MNDLFADVPKGHFGAILADPPWRFIAWGPAYGGRPRSGQEVVGYSTMVEDEISGLPVADVVGRDCILFLWTCWPILEQSLRVMKAWGFKYKTCGFCWMKANISQMDIFRDDADPRMGMGYWTRANSEVCLLGTKGNPKRSAADVRQGILEPIRQHSRKPDCVHERIERLVAGPYLELFARTTRPGWTSWGNETNKFDAPKPQTTEGIHARMAR
jgi:N6-adenosine-specific RNA methylase IME4